ncbi:MAG TPA: glycosyltransferase family 87 protein [Ktedonobacterales bacterium]
MFDTEKRIAIQPPAGEDEGSASGASSAGSRSWAPAEFIAAGLFLAACASFWNYLGAVLRPNALAAVSGSFGEDILPTYQAAQQILRGNGAAMYDPSIVHGYTYSPVFAWLFTPLALLPWSTAVLVWFALNSVWMVAAIALLERLFEEVLPTQLRSLRIGPIAVIPWLAAIWIGIPPSIQAIFEFGQVDYINLALLAGAFLCLLRRRDGLAGVLIVLAALLKITPIGLLAIFLVARRWRTLIFSVATLVIAVLATSLDPRVGFSSWLGMPHGVNANFAYIFQVYSNESLASVFAHLATLVHLHLTPQRAEYVGIAVAALLFVGAMGIGLARRNREEPPYVVAALAGLSAVLLASPLNWDHTYIVAAIPATFMLGRIVARWLRTHRLAWFDIAGALSAVIVASWPMTAGLAYSANGGFLRRAGDIVLIGARPAALVALTCLLLWEGWRVVQQSRPRIQSDTVA